LIYKLITPVLIVLTTISFLYGYQKNNKNIELEGALIKSIEERERTLQKIYEITTDYDKATNKNKKLSKRFISEVNKIIRLKDSVDELDNNLKKDKKVLSKKTILTNKLTDQNKVLSKEIKEAKSLNIYAIDVSAMKRKQSGKYIETSKLTKIDAFNISIQIAKNKLALMGQKLFHIQLINPNHKIISPSKKVLLNNKTLTYSGEIIFDYQRENIELNSMIEVNRDSLKPGEYLINAFINGKFVSKTRFNL